MHQYDTATYLPNPITEVNTFRNHKAPAPVTPGSYQIYPKPAPDWNERKSLLPRLTWEGHPDESSCWDTCWRLMFEHLLPATEDNQFLNPCVDTVFNGNVFLWDTVMTLQYAKYGERAFPVRGSLDNFYARQHPDGFICREVKGSTGEDAWSRHDPSSTGPDIFAWGEWDLYRLSGDKGRLEAVLPPLLGYFYWMRAFRGTPEGGRWYTGWGGGLDNQPRQPADLLPPGAHLPDGSVPKEYYWFVPGRMSWIDATAHALIAAQTLIRMIHETGSFQDHLPHLEKEEELLYRTIHQKMWNEETSFYADRFGDGSLSRVKSIVSYWVLLSNGVPEDRVAQMVSHLEDSTLFNRPHRVPTLSADDPLYTASGGYWRGGVWPPTTYMVVRGLQKQGYHGLARRIALNHIGNVTEVFRKTGTVWENYAPEGASPGDQAKPDMLGWSGLGPIALVIEAALGIEVDVPAGVVRFRPHKDAQAFEISELPCGTGGESFSLAYRPKEVPIRFTTNGNLQLEVIGHAY